MKISLLLGSLLLSATPALADDFIYLKCAGELKTESISIRSNSRLAPDGDKVILFFKIDQRNKRIMPAFRGKWDNALIDDGVLYQEKNDESGKFPIKSNLSMVIQPPGMYSGESLTRDEDFRYVTRVSGNCKGSNASAFKKDLNQQKWQH